MSRLKAAAPLFGLVFGMLLLGMGIINLGGTVASATWVPVPGVITRSAVETGGVRDRSATPTIEYSYVRRGERYTGDRVRFGLLTSPSSARKLVERHTVGDTVTVYIDPKHPERSVLQHSGLKIPIAQTVVGMLLLGIWLRAVRREKALNAALGLT